MVLSSNVICAGANIAFAPLIPTHDPDEFVASPVGRCVIGPSFAIWCYAPDLHGATLWGEVDERSLREMMAIGRFSQHPAMGSRRRVLTDCRDVERPDAAVLLGFVDSAREQLADWSTGLDRQALVVPAGPAGILLSGALPLAGLDHSLRVTTDIDAALAFLVHPAATAAYAAATTMIAGTRGRPALLSRLRAQLATDLNHATIESTAAALGMSTRTLQRELQRLNTSYSEQLRHARVVTAEALLFHTDLKIEAIATQVGYGTASRMSLTLRRELSLTASELRAIRREPRSSAT
ncbi:MAG TPA: helix-turn-helix transcriptional regulator [Kofleriaceae bacterium]